VAGARRHSEHSDGFGSGLLDTLDERSEICRRVWRLEERDRHLLFLWYVEQIPVDAISRRLGISRRQCFRRRGRAIKTLIDRPDVAA
jgi:DNA-directed RNA polymerase specialized sigma subunit